MPSNTAKFTPEKPNKGKQSHGVGITIFSAIILVVIVVTFIGAPVVSKVSQGPNATFGTYDGISIDFIQGNGFAQKVEQLNRFYEQFNQGSQNLEIQRQMVWRQAFEQTTLQIGLKREAELAGIVVTDGRVDKELVNNQAYQKDGKFSEELYRNTTSAERFKYHQDTKTQLLVQQYAMDHTQGSLVSEATKAFVAGMGYPERKFSFVTFSDADYPQNLVSDYAVKNKNLFRTIDVSRITVTTSEGDANKVRDEAVKGDKAFADLAKTYSKDPQAESGGAMGVRHYYDLKADFSKTDDLDKVFALGKGGVSPVFKGDKTWTVYKVNVPAADVDLTNTDTLVLVRAYIAKNDRGLMEDTLETQAKAFVAAAQNGKGGKSDFAGAAKALNKSVGTTDWVALNFGNHELFPAINQASKDPIFQSLASNEEFFKKAFHLNAGDISAPILASPSVIVLKVDEIKTAPVATDKAVLPDNVNQTIVTERSRELQQQILTSPKFKDQFQTEFNALFNRNK